MIRSIFVVIALIAGSSPLAAQMIRMVGTVTETATGHGLTGTDAELVSVGLDLSNFVGDDVDLTGMLVPGSNPPQVGVIAMDQADSWFRVLGDGRIGTGFGLRVDDSLATEYYTFVSFGRGFLPLNPLRENVHGTLFLDFSTLFNIAWGHMEDSWRQFYPIPNDPMLVGWTLQFQSAVVRTNGNLLYMNAESLTFTAP